MRLSLAFFIGCLAAAFSLSAAVAARGEAIAFVGARVIPIEGDEIENGVVLMNGTTIVAVGPMGDVTIPTFEQALGAITLEPARILGIADRVGTLEIGKDADAALFDGDPFEYATHCVGVVIEGRVVSNESR